MSRLEELIHNLCPNGVEYAELQKIAYIGTGSSNRVDAQEGGKYPFFVRSKQVMRSNRFSFDEEAIIIPGEGGIGDIFHYVNGKYDLHQRAYRISFKDKTVNTKFAYYYLRSNFKKFITMQAVTATVKSIRRPMIASFLFPLPPLPVQEEIVLILDAFSDVVTELEAEQQARVKQYKHYRNELLSFDSKSKIIERLLYDLGTVSVEYKPLKDVSKIFIGTFVKKTEQNVSFQYPVYNGGIDPTGYYNESNSEKNSVVISARGANCGFVNYLTVDFWAGNSCYVLKNLIIGISSKFLYYYLKANQEVLFNLRQKSGIPAINSEPLGKFLIPIVPLFVQEEIVSILDRFDALVNDLKSGLPAEIALRRKQYEYYRDKLLTFEPKPPF